MLCDKPEDVALQAKDRGIRRAAESRGALRYDVHNRLEVSRRAGDDPQDLRRCRLLLQRLFRLVEQADVLDGDHRLVGEGLEKLDLPLGEARPRPP